MGTQAGTCYTSVLLESCAPRYARCAHCCRGAAIFFVYIGEGGLQQVQIALAVIVKFHSCKVWLPWVQLFKYKANVDMGPDHHIGDAQSLLRDFKWLNTGCHRRIYGQLCFWHSDKAQWQACFRCTVPATLPGVRRLPCWVTRDLMKVITWEYHPWFCRARTTLHEIYCIYKGKKVKIWVVKVGFWRLVNCPRVVAIFTHFEDKIVSS